MPIRRCQGADAPKTTKKIVAIKNKPTRGGKTSPLALSEKPIMQQANTIRPRESTSAPPDLLHLRNSLPRSFAIPLSCIGCIVANFLKRKIQREKEKQELREPSQYKIQKAARD
jgi:hypothetical protein